ncbi:MAG: thrombospondin type-1 domain-containing protein, partial [Acidobacteriota bacterium]|nr:thrombospondin type-1 domain-containing protein [Acidobacteriota bacterium]
NTGAVAAGQTVALGQIQSVNFNSDNNNCGSCGNACTGGTTCQSGACAAPLACSGHGQMVNGLCLCEAGYTGADCSGGGGAQSCSGNGTLVNNVCVCNQGYTGADCSQLVSVQTCSGHGVSVNGLCQCEAGFTGADCSQSTLTPVDCVVSAWSAWGACSAVCGGGVQTRTRTVITPASNGGAACPALTESLACNTQPCVTYQWVFSDWSTCSAACGGGTQTRTAVCEDSNGTVVANSACAGLPPAAGPTSQACNTQACVTYQWVLSAWSACSATCGGGTQTRTAVCVDSSNNVVPDADCAGLPPATGATSMACNTQACPASFQ